MLESLSCHYTILSRGGENFDVVSDSWNLWFLIPRKTCAYSTKLEVIAQHSNLSLYLQHVACTIGLTVNFWVAFFKLTWWSFKLIEALKRRHRRRNHTSIGHTKPQSRIVTHTNIYSIYIVPVQQEYLLSDHNNWPRLTLSRLFLKISKVKHRETLKSLAAALSPGQNEYGAIRVLFTRVVPMNLFDCKHLNTCIIASCTCKILDPVLDLERSSGQRNWAHDAQDNLQHCVQQQPLHQTWIDVSRCLERTWTDMSSDT